MTNVGHHIFNVLSDILGSHGFQPNFSLGRTRKLLLQNIDALLKFSDALLDKFLSVLGK
jgi:hypothetical protein